MKRIFQTVQIALSGAATLLTLTAFAESPTPAAVGGVMKAPPSQVREAAAPPATDATPAFLKLHTSNKGKFDQIQGLIAQIENGKVVHDGDTQKLDQLMFDYANDLRAAFDQASHDAQDAGKTNGKLGSVQSLKLFEDQAQQHADTSKTFEPRMQAIQSKLRTGEIKLDRPMLLKMSPADMQQFKQFLSPPALQEMQKLNPDLMKGSPNKVQLEETATPELIAVAIPVPLSDSVEELLGNLIEEKADASLAAPCVGMCIAHNWPGCVSCLVSKGSGAINAWNSFVGCWNGSGTCDGWPWHWLNCVKKAACLAQLIYRLG